MGRIDLRVIREFQQLVMEARVEQRREFLRSVRCGEVRTANIADEQCVSGEDSLRTGGFPEISHHDADALRRMPRSLKEVEPALAELNRIAILYGCVGKRRTGFSTE